MLRRILPAVLAALAAYADGRGAHGLAFDALLGAIPFAAVAALESFGAYLDERRGGIHALLWTLALALICLSCAARSPATQTHTLPALGWSSLVACLAVFGLQIVLTVGPQLRRLVPMRPAKP